MANRDDRELELVDNRMAVVLSKNNVVIVGDFKIEEAELPEER